MRLRSDYVANVALTGAGKFLRLAYRRAKREAKGLWFGVGMHGEPQIGEHLFFCRLDSLPQVIAAIAAEAPDFKMQLSSLLNRLPGPGVAADDSQLPLEGKDHPKLRVLGDDATALLSE